MKFGKKEKQGLMVVGMLLYIVLFVQYNVKNAIPSIKENIEKNQTFQTDLDTFEKDLKQIEGLKRMHLNLVAANERYSDFISQNSDLVKSMEYMEKLKRLFLGKIENVKFSKPELKKKTAVPYYYCTTEFIAKLKLQELNDLAQFIEGGVKKMKITKIDIKPSEELKTQKQDSKNLEEEISSINSTDLELNVKIAITAYSMELGSAENLYELSRSKFEEFVGYDGIVFATDNNKEQSQLKNKDKVTIINFGEGEKTLPNSSQIPNIAVTIHSFFAGGSNFILVANRGANNQFANFKTKERQNVTINFNDYIYSLKTDGLTGKKIDFSGEVPSKTRYLTVNAKFTDILENKNLGADIKIVNNSQYNIVVQINGRKDKISIFDRNGSRVFGKGEKDKIFIT